MKPAVSSKKKAVILGALVGIFALLWYSRPFPWLGLIMGPFGGLFTYFILSRRRMERMRVFFFSGMAIFVLVTLTANILYLGYYSFLEWVRLWDIGYLNPEGTAVGTSPFPLPILIPTILLGQAEFIIKESVWRTTVPGTIDIFLLFMIPYLVTFLVFERGFCGWICPLGGLPELTSSFRKKRKWFLRFMEKKPSKAGGFSLTGLSGLQGWLEWLKYGIMVAVALVSILVPFSIVNIISPALWLKSIPIFWTLIVVLVVFAILLPIWTKRRWWCDIICPVGAVLALLHKISLFRIKIDKTKCNECMDCVQECRMFAMTPQGVREGWPRSGNCIKCGRCIEACPEEAIDIAFLGKYKNVRAPFITLVLGTVFAWYLWFVVLLISYSTKITHFRGLG